MKKLRIVIGGFIGLYPSGGVTWDYVQYPLGLHLLGHDVYYIEDTMQYSHYQSAGESWDDSTSSIQYLKKTMESFGLGDKWAYRDIGTNTCYGLSLQKVQEICKTADVFLNISAATFLREEYLNIPIRVLVDSDPFFTQVQDWDDANPEKSYDLIRNRYSLYNYRFSFGENIGNQECKVPTYDLEWLHTRQPICLDYWTSNNHNGKSRDLFTTVMNWSVRKELIYQQQAWGQKDVEFRKFIGIPAKFNHVTFSIAMAVSKDYKKDVDKTLMGVKGWNLLNPSEVISTANDYKNFIESSSGEFSVAKEAYVKSNSGWFSCRSACYLAAGKPVITQETGWSSFIPPGEGLFAFTDEESAVASLSEVTRDIKKHSRAAKEIAREYFDSERILDDMLFQLQ